MIPHDNLLASAITAACFTPGYGRALQAFFEVAILVFLSAAAPAGFVFLYISFGGPMCAKQPLD